MKRHLPIHVAAWGFVGPALLAIAAFFVMPVLAALALSLTDFDLYALADLRNLRFVALDYGVVGRLTRLYVIAGPHGDQTPRCIGNGQCPDGKGGTTAGCVDGQCAGLACPAGTCPANQFCVGGFCTTRCDQGGGQCASGLVCKVRACVAPGAPGTCDAAQKDQDCPLGEICLAGRCEIGCHHPRKQDQTYAQDPTFCAGNSPALCPHCPDPKQGCWNNVCSECEVDAACATGLVCVDRKCVKPW